MKRKTKKIRPGRRINKTFFGACVSAALIVSGFFIVVPVIFADTTTDYITTSGTDVSDGNSHVFNSSDITKLGLSDDSRMQSNKWPDEVSDYDETKYIEFIFSPDVPAGATISSVTVTHEYRRSGILAGAKLEVWDGNTWRDETLNIPSVSNTDLSETKDVSSYVASYTKINSIKIRFLAYRSDNGNTKTSHDFIKLTATYAPDTVAPTVTLSTTSSDSTDTAPISFQVVFSETVSEFDAADIEVTNGSVSGFSSDDGRAYDFNVTSVGSGAVSVNVPAGVASDAAGNLNEAALAPVSVVYNNTPIAVDDIYIADEDATPIIGEPGVLANDTDIDGDSLTAALVSGPVHGVLILNASGSFTYTPTVDYRGSDSFSYRANDGATNSNEATVSITVNEVAEPTPAPTPTSTPESSSGGGGGGGGNNFFLLSTPTPLATLSNSEMAGVDLNGDGKINVLDLVIILINWDNNSGNNPADTNKDDKIDIADFNLLMINWSE